MNYLLHFGVLKSSLDFFVRVDFLQDGIILHFFPCLFLLFFLFFLLLFTYVSEVVSHQSWELKQKLFEGGIVAMLLHCASWILTHLIKYSHRLRILKSCKQPGWLSYFLQQLRGTPLVLRAFNICFHSSLDFFELEVFIFSFGFKVCHIFDDWFSNWFWLLLFRGWVKKPTF